MNAAGLKCFWNELEVPVEPLAAAELPLEDFPDLPPFSCEAESEKEERAGLLAMGAIMGGEEWAATRLIAAIHSFISCLPLQTEETNSKSTKVEVMHLRKKTSKQF